MCFLSAVSIRSSFSFLAATDAAVGILRYFFALIIANLPLPENPEFHGISCYSRTTNIFAQTFSTAVSQECWPIESCNSCTPGLLFLEKYEDSKYFNTKTIGRDAKWLNSSNF